MSVTDSPVPSDIPEAWGFVAIAIAVVFFGCNFVPVKKFETGDGMFFQWILCSAIWFVGLVVNFFRWFPTFQPLAMLGGFLWATGNITVVPIIKTIGLGQGLLIWGSFNLLSGWASGRFGFFGLTAQIPKNVTFNYIGVAFCLCSAVIYIFIKSESQTRVDSEPSEVDLLIPSREGLQNAEVDAVSARETDDTFLETLPVFWKRIIGSIMAVIAGLLYGVNFTPPIYIKNHAEDFHDASQNGTLVKLAIINATPKTNFFLPNNNYRASYGVEPGRMIFCYIISTNVFLTIFITLTSTFPSFIVAQVSKTMTLSNLLCLDLHSLDYVFAHFCGIYVTSFVYFVIYCAYMQNVPRIYPRAILPGILSGLMWGVAQTAWFVANFALSEAISFPIVTTVPGMIAALWGLYFKEIRGRRNLVILVVAFTISITGSVLTGLSK